MHILADENITLAKECFAPYGRISLCAGRRITNELLQDVDVLLVRSVTRVDENLLKNSPCRYVATATSGVDHVDTAYLAAEGIGFAAARGCNAEGVVDYVLSALAALALESDVDWLSRGIGIVGCGEIGSRLAHRLIALGKRPKIFDPFLPASHPLRTYFAPREEVLQQSIVSLHVPLTHDGDYPTRHMVDAEALSLMPPNGILLNVARGEVVDEAALKEHLRGCPNFVAILDAWHNEPLIDLDLLPLARYASPHIAGYSHGGKLRGTTMIHAQFCAHFGLDPRLAAQPMPMPPTPLPHVDEHISLTHALSQLILAAYDLRQDDAALRRSVAEADRGAAFDGLRRNYPLRREFNEFRVANRASPALRKAAAGLGMKLSD